MKIAVISDTHDDDYVTKEVLKFIASRQIETIIHCGDVSASRTMELFKHFCVCLAYGNNDIDQVGLSMTLRECKPGSCAGPWYKGVIDGKLIAAVHDEHSARFSGLLESGQFDYIFVGHTHRRSDRMNEKTRVINPGAIGGARRGPRGFCILDLATGEKEDYELE